MVFVDTLINTIFVFSPQESVVLDIVDQLEHKLTGDSIDDLVLDRLPSEDSIDSQENGGVDHKVHGHFVQQNNSEERNIVSLNFLDFLDLSAPCVIVALDERSEVEVVY